MMSSKQYAMHLSHIRIKKQQNFSGVALENSIDVDFLQDQLIKFVWDQLIKSSWFKIKKELFYSFFCRDLSQIK